MNPLSLLFRQGNQTLFFPQILLKLGGLEFIVPVNLSIGLHKKLVITEVFGADFSVKEDFGVSDFQISIEGRIGNTDSSTGAKICGIDKQVNALSFLNQLILLYKIRGALEISDVNPDYAQNLLGKGLQKIDQAFDLPFGGPSEPEGILNSFGITRVVLSSLDIAPLGAGHYRFTIACSSEPAESDIWENEKINLFLEEK